MTHIITVLEMVDFFCSECRGIHRFYYSLEELIDIMEQSGLTHEPCTKGPEEAKVAMHWMFIPEVIEALG